MSDEDWSWTKQFSTTEDENLSVEEREQQLLQKARETLTTCAHKVNTNHECVPDVCSFIAHTNKDLKNVFVCQRSGQIHLCGKWCRKTQPPRGRQEDQLVDICSFTGLSIKKSELIFIPAYYYYEENNGYDVQYSSKCNDEDAYRMLDDEDTIVIDDYGSNVKEFISDDKEKDEDNNCDEHVPKKNRTLKFDVNDGTKGANRKKIVHADFNGIEGHSVAKSIIDYIYMSNPSNKPDEHTIDVLILEIITFHKLCIRHGFTGDIKIYHFVQAMLYILSQGRKFNNRTIIPKLECLQGLPRLHSATKSRKSRNKYINAAKGNVHIKQCIQLFIHPINSDLPNPAIFFTTQLKSIE